MLFTEVFSRSRFRQFISRLPPADYFFASRLFSPAGRHIAGPAAADSHAGHTACRRASHDIRWLLIFRRAFTRLMSFRQPLRRFRH